MSEAELRKAVDRYAERKDFVITNELGSGTDGLVEAQREAWGDRWPEVQSIIGQLASLGIICLDAKVGNIAFDNSHVSRPRSN